MPNRNYAWLLQIKARVGHDNRKVNVWNFVFIKRNKRMNNKRVNTMQVTDAMLHRCYSQTENSLQIQVFNLQLTHCFTVSILTEFLLFKICLCITLTIIGWKIGYFFTIQIRSQNFNICFYVSNITSNLIMQKVQL